MLHDLDPFLWQISGDFGIRWYGLAYLAGFLFAYGFLSWLTPRQRFGMNAQLAGDIITYGAIGVLVGGRLGYCVFYSPDLFLQFKGSFPFWGVLAVNEGGMASHGGMIGLAIACILFARKHGINQLYLLDLACISAPMGIFFGRMANFINGELVGRVAPNNYSFGVRFPQDIFNWPSYEFPRLESLTATVQGVGVSADRWMQLLSQYRVEAAARDEVNSILHQVVNAVQSGNEVVKSAIVTVLDLRYPSQIFAGLGEGLFLFLILFIIWRVPRKPGVVGSWFMVLYAIARIWGEQYRTPDLHIGYEALNLTRGQWLSVVMLLMGLVFLFLFSRRIAMPIPGWGQGPTVKLHRK